MMRLSLIVFILAAAVIIAFTRQGWLVIGALPAGYALNILAWKSAKKSIRALLPVTIFVATLSLIQWFYHNLNLEVAAKTLAVFWLTTSAFQLTPWNRLGDAIHPGSRLATPILYVLFMRHFALILSGESRRLLTARSRTVFRPYGRWSFRSLVSALVSLFLRAMSRAERFYAAQILKGL
jgi:hypothetical protein